MHPSDRLSTSLKNYNSNGYLSVMPSAVNYKLFFVALQDLNTDES